MKRLLWTGLLLIAMSISLTGCGPATLASDSFAGTWTTNLGSMNFVQSGSEITGNIEGYGGIWNETFTGTINGNGEAVFDTEILGEFTLVLSGEDAFKSTTSELSFCGVRGVDMELPSGCGFSGTWFTSSRFPAVDKGHIILTQTGATVTGNFYNAMGEKNETFTGTMEWGKGWRANGVTLRRGDLSLWMNSSETGFQLIYGESGNPQELCAVREGVDSAYLSSFTCQPLVTE
jgi:hypothetical protein